MKKLKLIGTTALALAMLAMSACSGGTTADAGKTSTPPAAVSSVPASAAPAPTSVAPADSAAPAVSTAPGADASTPASGDTIASPLIVTSCGQSPGAVMINMLAIQAGLTSSNDNSLTSKDFVAGDAKTLVVTTGTSGKGMGAAGTDVNAEIERCKALIETAKEAGLTIVGAHIEGMARRTDSADAASIEAVMALADVILVIDDSDSDGFFTKYAADNDKPLIKVKTALDISSVLS